MDALRYGLVHLFDLGANYHLEDVAVPKGQKELVAAAPKPDKGIFTMSDSF